VAALERRAGGEQPGGGARLEGAIERITELVRAVQGSEEAYLTGEGRKD
jgi:hypothetical protein